MNKRKTLIVGNWKEHENVSQASILSARLHKLIAGHRDIEVVLAPSTLVLQPLSLEIDKRRFKLAVQDANQHDSGPYTGEVSFSMVRGLAQYGIVGHSERRIHFHESLEIIRDKMSAAIRNGIAPILCVGETSDERSAGETLQVLHDQLTTALSNLTAEDVEHVVIAYEPVWAIKGFGGVIAKPDDVQKCLSFLRNQVSALYGETIAQNVRILYGGSVDEHSVGAYLSLDDCDGVLVGTASLNYRKFSAIVEVAYRLNRT
jgi:triosephosphate isomerase (TIM)